MEEQGASAQQLLEYLGKGRAQKGIHLGDLEEGELEVGQISGMIHDLPTVHDLVQKLITEYNQTMDRLKPIGHS